MLSPSSTSPALPPSPPPRLALVGDRSPAVQAHARIPGLIGTLAAPGPRIEIYWMHSTGISSGEDLSGFDGVWVVPGSPYASGEGVITAIETARSRSIPFLGTCGGFQYMLLELARHCGGTPGAASVETEPGAADPLIVPLVCSLLGEEEIVTVQPGTRAAAIMGAGPSSERFFCRYGLNVAYLERLERAGLVVSGRDADGAVRLAELADHPFFVGSLFQPELSSDATWLHPLIAAFAAAVRQCAAQRGAQELV